MLKLFVKVQEAIQLKADESGQDMIEYALLGALIAVVVAAAIPALTNAITGEFLAVQNAL